LKRRVESSSSSGRFLPKALRRGRGYTNFPDYDIVAGDPAAGRICRIQVKSRFVVGASDFPVKNLNCDFVCFVRLNREYRTPRADGVALPQPEIYVVPRNVAEGAWVKTSDRPYVQLSKIDGRARRPDRRWRRAGRLLRDRRPRQAQVRDSRRPSTGLRFPDGLLRRPGDRPRGRQLRPLLVRHALAERRNRHQTVADTPRNGRRSDR
jgi:hypothetical protein